MAAPCFHEYAAKNVRAGYDEGDVARLVVTNNFIAWFTDEGFAHRFAKDSTLSAVGTRQLVYERTRGDDAAWASYGWRPEDTVPCRIYFNICKLFWIGDDSILICHMEEKYVYDARADTLRLMPYDFMFLHHRPQAVSKPFAVWTHADSGRSITFILEKSGVVVGEVKADEFSSVVLLDGGMLVRQKSTFIFLTTKGQRLACRHIGDLALTELAALRPYAGGVNRFIQQREDSSAWLVQVTVAGPVFDITTVCKVCDDVEFIVSGPAGDVAVKNRDEDRLVYYKPNRIHASSERGLWLRLGVAAAQRDFDDNDMGPPRKK